MPRWAAHSERVQGARRLVGRLFSSPQPLSEQRVLQAALTTPCWEKNNTLAHVWVTVGDHSAAHVAVGVTEDPAPGTVASARPGERGGTERAQSGEEKRPAPPSRVGGTAQEGGGLRVALAGRTRSILFCGHQRLGTLLCVPSSFSGQSSQACWLVGRGAGVRSQLSVPPPPPGSQVRQGSLPASRRRPSPSTPQFSEG